MKGIWTEEQLKLLKPDFRGEEVISHDVADETAFIKFRQVTYESHPKLPHHNNHLLVLLGLLCIMEFQVLLGLVV